jgi:hypothetical protein
MTVAELMEKAKALSPQEQKELIKLLVDRLGDISPESILHKPHRLSDLRGLGAEIWQGTDAQEYVDQQRDEWDARS